MQFGLNMGQLRGFLESSKSEQIERVELLRLPKSKRDSTPVIVLPAPDVPD